jgi:hypothetical protein
MNVGATVQLSPQHIRDTVMNMHRRLLPMLLILIMAGCRFAPQLPPYDSKKAEEILVLALDAWKQGRIVTLLKRNPPVRFEDEDQRNGLRLVEYRLEPRDTPVFQFNDIKVILSLRDRRGNKIEKNVVYQITLEPAPAVLRND